MTEILRPPVIACFDVDGTLHNTYNLIYDAFLATFEEHNLGTRTKEQIDATMGFPLPRCYQILAPGVEYAKLAQTHRDFQERHTQLVVPFENTLSALDELKSEGLKIAAITARNKTSALLNMERTGVAPFIDTVIAAEDIRNAKPHPEGIFKAVTRLGGTVYRASMSGDMGVDVGAGRLANVKTVIGAAYGFQGPNIALTHPDYTVQDVSEMVPIILLELGVITKKTFLDRAMGAFLNR